MLLSVCALTVSYWDKLWAGQVKGSGRGHGRWLLGSQRRWWKTVLPLSLLSSYTHTLTLSFLGQSLTVFQAAAGGRRNGGQLWRHCQRSKWMPSEWRRPKRQQKEQRVSKRRSGTHTTHNTLTSAGTFSLIHWLLFREQCSLSVQDFSYNLFASLSLSSSSFYYSSFLETIKGICQSWPIKWV